MRVRLSTLLLAVVVGAAASATPAGAAPGEIPLPRQRPELVIPRIDQPPLLEDFLGMACPPEWEGRLAVVEGFTQQSPEDGRPASQRTQVFLGYDDQAVHLVFLAFDERPDLIRAHLSRREDVLGDEIVEVQFDTFDDERRAYSFIANPFGIQTDAIWTEGQGFDFSWDTVWQTRGRITDRGYVVTMEIPFKSLRFPRTPEQTWGIVLVRDIPRNNESSFWPRVSNRIEGRLNQAGRLRGLRGIAPGRNILLIPYGTAVGFRVLEEREDGSAGFVRDDVDPDGGLDAKLVLQDKLALDFTLNPDFSQVESDQPQVTVNERFEVFFPEKRPFFLENADLFETPGRSDLVFTRRIRDPRAGARLTGKVGRYALGALLIDDEFPGDQVDPADPAAGAAAHFGILRLIRDLGRQNKLGLIYTERRFDRAHNRVGGIDGRFKLDDNWDSRFVLVHGSTRELDGTQLDGPLFEGELNRSGRKYSQHIHYRDIGRDFRTEAGFVPRTDLRDLHQSASYTFRPEKRRLLSWRPSLYLQRVEDHDGTRLDTRFQPELEWEFRRQTSIELFLEGGRERLRVADFPGLTGPLDFYVQRHGFAFDTRFVNAVELDSRFSAGRTINFAPPAGEAPYLADVQRADVTLTLRPFRQLRIDNTWLLTRLEDRGDGARIFSNQILRTRWGWQFDPKLSLRAIVQYERTDPDPLRTRLERDRRLNGDLLLTYLVNPWTAIYAGYTSNYRNVELVDGPGGRQAVLTRDLELNDARQLFVKVSYLFRL